MERAAQPSRTRAVVEFLVVGLCTLAFALNAAGVGATLLTDNYASTRDFVTYWSSGHQLAHRANPYDREAILSLEHSVGYSLSTAPLIMRNPPPSLLLVLPLGFFSIRAASWFWTLLMLASLLVSVRTIAAMHDRRKSQLNWLAYTFAPVLSCLIAGQMALFVLLGLVLFLRFHATRPMVAGSALWLCALKPHLFLPFAAVLLVWIVAEKRYRILLGAALAIFASAVVIFIIDPSAWAQYGFMMRAAKLDIAIIPCISMAVRLLVSPRAIWIQYLPAVFGCVWALAYFRDRRRSWDWLEHGSLLMLVSVVVAPYSWFMDQAVLLPALLHALYQNRSRTLVAVFALLSAVIEIANFRGVPLGYWPLYSVMAPAWLVWYLWTRHRAEESDRPAADGLVPSADPRATERRMKV